MALRFCVYPCRGDRRRYDVVIFHDARQMRAADRLAHGDVPAATSRWLAQARGFTRRRRVRGRWVTSPLLGELFFSRGRLGAGIVAHECVHAALYYCLRTVPRFNARRAAHDERLAAAAGELVRQFWLAYHRRGLAPRPGARARGRRPGTRRPGSTRARRRVTGRA